MQLALFFSLFIGALCSPQEPSIDIGDLPSCAVSFPQDRQNRASSVDAKGQQKGIIPELASGPCELTDIACICKDKQLQAELAKGIKANCNAKDQSGMTDLHLIKTLSKTLT